MCECIVCVYLCYITLMSGMCERAEEREVSSIARFNGVEVPQKHASQCEEGARRARNVRGGRGAGKRHRRCSPPDRRMVDASGAAEEPAPRAAGARRPTDGWWERQGRLRSRRQEPPVLAARPTDGGSVRGG